MPEESYRPWLLHAFSLDMLPKGVRTNLIVEAVDDLPRTQLFRVAIGQEVVAQLVAQLVGTPLAWEQFYNPATVALVPGDVAYVARFRGTWPGMGQRVALTDTNLDLWRVTIAP